MALKKNYETIGVLGLGYVGLPLAIEFAKTKQVVGFDVDEDRIAELRANYDRTSELDEKQIQLLKRIEFSTEPASLKKCDFYIVTVPTPVDENNSPNLLALEAACETVARYIDDKDIVVFESTVFPGCTEQFCVPILEAGSGMLCHKLDDKGNSRGFYAGYSPERVNPGDRSRRIPDIVKVTSASTNDSAKMVAEVYGEIVSAGIFEASSIQVAEAAKVIENTQRDINIALINELALIFSKMNISTTEVLRAASTKWNFLNFVPGLVGGHCIGVDPFYLAYKSRLLGHEPRLILSGREVNDSMAKFIANTTIKELAKSGVEIKEARVGVVGVTFKENCPDIRNSKVFDVIDELLSWGVEVVASDDYADTEIVSKQHSISLMPMDKMIDLDGLILAVNHDYVVQKKLDYWLSMFNGNAQRVIFDVKSCLGRSGANGSKAVIIQL